jgi:hypothetical protein
VLGSDTLGCANEPGFGTGPCSGGHPGGVGRTVSLSNPGGLLRRFSISNLLASGVAPPAGLFRLDCAFGIGCRAAALIKLFGITAIIFSSIQLSAGFTMNPSTNAQATCFCNARSMILARRPCNAALHNVPQFGVKFLSPSG